MRYGNEFRVLHKIWAVPIKFADFFAKLNGSISWRCKINENSDGRFYDSFRNFKLACCHCRHAPVIQTVFHGLDVLLLIFPSKLFQTMKRLFCLKVLSPYIDDKYFPVLPHIFLCCPGEPPTNIVVCCRKMLSISFPVFNDDNDRIRYLGRIQRLSRLRFLSRVRYLSRVWYLARKWYYGSVW